MPPLSENAMLLVRSATELRRLVDDIDRIEAGTAPDQAELSSAPVLMEWSPELEPAITGAVYGHPEIPDGGMLRADVVAVDRHLTWIRSWDRFYRLGKSARDLERGDHA